MILFIGKSHILRYLRFNSRMGNNCIQNSRINQEKDLLRIAFTIKSNKNIIKLNVVCTREVFCMRISGVTYAVRKTHTFRKFLLAFLILILLGVLALVCVSAYYSWLLLHPEKQPLETFSANIVPEYRDISFPSTDKSITLKGWVFQPKKTDRAVIIVHSYGKNRLEYGIETVDLIKEFLNRNYGVLAFDLRNSGESDGKDSTFGYNEKDDVLAAIRYMNSQGYKNITLLGFSTGASASILAAAENESVDAVIADSPYADLEGYLSSSLDKMTNLPAFPFNRAITFAIKATGGIEMEKASPVNALTETAPKNLMLIHGKEYEPVPVINSIELFQKYSALNSSGAEFWMVEGTGNTPVYEAKKDEYIKRIFDFLDRIYSD